MNFENDNSLGFKKKRNVINATNSIRKEEKDNFYDLDASIGFNVRLFTKKLRYTMLSNFEERGLKVSIEEWVCLAYLFRYEDVYQHNLPEALSQDKTAITRILDGLEKKKLVRRSIDKIDNRNRILKLSAKGKKTYKNLKPIVEATILEAKRGIDEKDFQITIQTLKKLKENLEIF